MPRAELHSDDIKIKQKPTIVIKPKGSKLKARSDGAVEMSIKIAEVEKADPSELSPEYLEELAFMEEPVCIRLEPSTDKNAATVFPIWVNGRGADVLMREGRFSRSIDEGGKWRSITWLPVGGEIVVKRSVLEVIVRAKVDTIETEIIENPGQDPENRVKRFTSPIHSFSVIEERNPRGHEWLRMVRRRNY